MTKIMTSIIAFDLLKNEISMDDKFVISKMHGECLKVVIHHNL